MRATADIGGGPVREARRTAPRGRSRGDCGSLPLKEWTRRGGSVTVTVFRVVALDDQVVDAGSVKRLSDIAEVPGLDRPVVDRFARVVSQRQVASRVAVAENDSSDRQLHLPADVRAIPVDVVVGFLRRLVVDARGERASGLCEAVVGLILASASAVLAPLSADAATITPASAPSRRLVRVTFRDPPSRDCPRSEHSGVCSPSRSQMPACAPTCRPAQRGRSFRWWCRRCSRNSSRRVTCRVLPESASRESARIGRLCEPRHSRGCCLLAH